VFPLERQCVVKHDLKTAVAFCLERDIDEHQREFQAVKENQQLEGVHHLAELALS
jgi:hypothetical protein